MKKIIIWLGLVLLGSVSNAQVAPADALKMYNDTICEKAGLAAGCSDSQHLTATCEAQKLSPCVDNRAVNNKVYATITAWNTAVNVVEKHAELLEKRKNTIIERLVRAVLNNKAKCVVILTAAELDTIICK